MLNLAQSNAKPRQLSLHSPCRNKYNLGRLIQNGSNKQDHYHTVGISIFSGSKLAMGDVVTAEFIYNTLYSILDNYQKGSGSSFLNIPSLPSLAPKYNIKVLCGMPSTKFTS